jgi:DNA-binding protein HU-beta
MSDKILSRGDIISAVAAQVDLPQAKVDAVIKAFESSVARQLAAKGEIRMAGFGTFKTSDRSERTSRNPRTGEPVTVAARTVARFVPGKGLKEAAEGSGSKAKAAPKKAAAAKSEATKKPAAKKK